MNVKELKALAKERAIKGYYRLRKAELIEILGIQAPPTNAPATIMEEPVPEIINQFSPQLKWRIDPEYHPWWGWLKSKWIQ